MNDKGTNEPLSNSFSMERQKESDDCLSLSLTPPILDQDKKNENSDESISEHLSSQSTSVENDRSYQEIEISNRPNVLFNIVTSADDAHNISRENQCLLDASVCSDDSIISLNYLERVNNSSNDNVRSILEELLSNEQFHSDKALTSSNSNDSIDIFANVDLDDKSLSNRRYDNSHNEKISFVNSFQPPILKDESSIVKTIQEPLELIAVKDPVITGLTSELDSFREMSNTNTTSTLSTTEYKQLQEDCHSKLLEYNSAIIYKNELIQQLSESLDQSVMERKGLLKQIGYFKDEIAILQKKLEETTKMMSSHKYQFPSKPENKHQVNCEILETDSSIKSASWDSDINLDLQFSAIEKSLNIEQMNQLNNLKLSINKYITQNLPKKDLYVQEIEKLEAQKKLETDEYETEIARLRNLLSNIKCGSTEIMEIKNELEAQHSREVEELRTYFEKKCADLEKNYSEEVFSQQSRKMSGSTCSDAELNSDMLFSHPPGPAGDVRYDIQPNLTKKDIINLKNELSSILDKINKHNIENITDDDFNNLKVEISQTNLNNLLKYDLTLIKNDLQNKYHAELEVLREDHENKVDLLNVQYEQKFKDSESKYLEEINDLKLQIDELNRTHLSVSSAVQEVSSSGEFEINEVIQSYERRLQEQVSLAKIDIISALENQIQRLAASEVDNEEWPSELLQLRDKFANKYEAEIQILKTEHKEEIDKLKEEHLKILNGALERARRKSLRDSDSLSKGELGMLKERDNLKKQVSSLRNLLGELLKYFTQCEDELNNTLVEELLKHGFDKNMSTVEEEFNVTNSSQTSSSKTSDTSVNVTRVHLTPNFTDLLSLIENNSQEDCDSKDISIDLKNELGGCLEKLRQEANAILMLTTIVNRQEPTETTTSSLEQKVSLMTRQLIDEVQSKKKLKEELDEALEYIESLGKEKDELEKQLEQVVAKVKILESDLVQAKNKIAELIENGHKEIVSEGYGEEGSNMRESGDSMVTLSELQERARSMLASSRTSADPSLLHLIEELCRLGEKIKEESKRDKQDLLQQIDVADKKYKTTQKFLEEQAVEREQERDEAQKTVNMLMEQLRERDKDRTSCERAFSEVEQLEQQLHEMTRAFNEESQKCKDFESELNEAIEKIKVLREIIRELESQSEAKSYKINDCMLNIQKLQTIVEQQERSIDNGEKCDSSKDVSDVSELYRHIEYLENELQQLRVYSELVGSEGALKEIGKQLFNIETQLDKKTKELENLHFSGSTNCSSPSEDISARDIVQSSPNTMDECEVPLQQLARLKEKLIRHSRAEDAAMKRIKDLEMQAHNLKTELEESNGEKEYMKRQIQEQLVLISDLQIRLDEQRIRAEHIEQQTNTSLELKIYDMQNEIVSLREKLQTKEKSLLHQQNLLKRTQDQVRQLENEISNTKEDEIIVAMQKELEMLRTENVQMKARIDKDSEIVPNLVENIISDKNMDIEKLRDKLNETEKLLEAYTSLSLDLKDLQTLSNLKSHGTSLEQMISVLDLSQPDQMRRMDYKNDSESLSSSNMLNRKKSAEQSTLEPEISAIMGSNNIHSGVHVRNSTEVSPKRVHFEDSHLDSLKLEVTNLKLELESHQEVLKTYEERIKVLDDIETKMEETERQRQELHEKERNLGIELAEKKLQLSEKEKAIEILEQDSNRKDEMCFKLTMEKKKLEKALSTAKYENYNSIDSIIKQKNDEIDQIKIQINELQHELDKKNTEMLSMQSYKNDLETKLNNLTKMNVTLEESLKEVNNENVKLNKELKNNSVQIEAITNEMDNLKDKLNKKRRIIKEFEFAAEKYVKTIAQLETEIQKQKNIIVDRECEIEIANEDAKRYQNDLMALEEENTDLKKEDIHKLLDEVKEKTIKEEELNKEKAHLLELLSEKEKIINQMAEDSHQLHVNLVTIKSKIKEPGNIIYLGNKLKDEQRKTAELVQEIHHLKAQLMRYKNSDMINSVEEITDQVKRELDYSAQIDSNIISAVSDQSLSSISESHDVETYKKALAKEKSSKKDLLSQINNLEAKIAEMQTVLENEHALLVKTQVEDAKLIEQLRIQLDALLDKEEDLKKAVSDKQTHYERLEQEFEALKRKTVSCSISKTESTEYKQLPSREILELKQLKKDYDTLQDEKRTILEEFASLQQAMNAITNDLKYTKDMLTVELLRCKNLEDKVQCLLRSEKELRECVTQKNLENERLLTDMEQEKANFTKQKNDLMQMLKTQTELGPQPLLSTPVPDMILDQIKELNSALLDNRKLLAEIHQLTNDKRALEQELFQARRDRANDVPFGDLVARSDYLFAKTLKLESVRKALIWQKRYLTEYLLSHQKHCLVPSVAIPGQGKNKFGSKLPPMRRFRSAVFAVISTLRMKYLVRRWNSGVRIAERVNMRHYRNSLEQSRNAAASTHFQVGHPVSSQVFSNTNQTAGMFHNLKPFNTKPDSTENVRCDSYREGGPWSGNTPPSKEGTNQHRIQIGSNILDRDDLTPLRAPKLLADFAERIDQIHEKLGVVLDTNAT